jgi:signal transduction histidine kinase
LPAYLGQLSEQLTSEQQRAIAELESLQQNIDHIKEIVAMQQSYAKVSGVTEIVNLTDLVEDAARMNSGALARHEVELVREYGEAPPLTVEKHKVLQILVNLIRNAKYACDESGRSDKQIKLKISQRDGWVSVAVIDNGVGIPPENWTRIFSHGFTTRKGGHGFGLHSGALAAKELGGALTMHSDGAGKGATFTLELPLQPPRNGE